MTSKSAAEMAYEEAIFQALKAREEAIFQALKTYHEVASRAWETYHEVIFRAWETYDEAQKDGEVGGMAHKYRKGRQISSLTWLIMEIDIGNRVYWHDSPKDPQVILNMPLDSILKGLRAGIIYEAIKRGENDQD